MNPKIKENVTRFPWNHLHFIGIGGVGMAGLALLAKELGVYVTGTDEEESANTKFLKSKGICVVIGHSRDLHDKPNMIVYSSAVKRDNPVFQQAQTSGIPVLRRGEFLAELTTLYPKTVLISGSHGKTTVTAMVSHILSSLGKEPAYLVGGGIGERPFLAGAGMGEILVAEVDESDGTLSIISATHAVITNIDDDHSWSLGGVDKLIESFNKFAFSSDYLLTNDSPVTRKLFKDHKNAKLISSGEVCGELSLPTPGLHNRFNAFLAVCVAAELGIEKERAIQSVNEFTGVTRRLTVRYKCDAMVLIEDYAHHPTAVRESLNAIKENYPDNRRVIVFQPHRYERVRRYAIEFAKELSEADLVFILPPFSAWLDKEDFGESIRIVKEIRRIPAYYQKEPFPDLAYIVVNNLKKGDVLIVMGAGDITNLVPILTDILKKKAW